MRFDVGIGNPPYTISSDKGTVTSYSKFIEMLIDIGCKYVSMIVPSKWMNIDGYGDSELKNFRQRFIGGHNIRYIADYIDSSECFTSIRVAGGICYFLWDFKYCGNCTVNNIKNNNIALRDLSLSDIIIRDNIGKSIIDKVLQHDKNMLSDKVIVNPFNLSEYNNDTDTVEEQDTKMYDILVSSNNSLHTKKISVLNIGNHEYVDSYKLIVGKLLAGGGDHPIDKNGQMKILSGIYMVSPGTVFVPSYIMVVHDRDKNIVRNCEKYIKTKFVRFLIYIALAGLNINEKSFKYVPIQDFCEDWSDSKLYKRYNLNSSEINHIESLIKGIE